MRESCANWIENDKNIKYIMKADFLSRFKGRTSTMSKEGVTGIVKGSSTPIEKMP